MIFDLRYKFLLNLCVLVVESEQHLIPALLLVCESVQLEMRW